MNDNESHSSGLGIPGVVFLIFLVLKLAGVVSWSWWLVTAPLWVPIIAGFVIILVLAMVAVVKVAIDTGKKR